MRSFSIAAIHVFVICIFLGACGKHQSEGGGVVRASDVFNGQRDKLVSAIESGDLNTIDDLLKKGLDVNAKLPNGRPLLVHATIQGQLKVMNLLIKRGADLKLTDSDNKTALDYATETGDPRALILLDSTKQEAARVALINGIKTGRNVTRFLEEGADPNFIDLANQGESPLTLAIALQKQLAAEIIATWVDPLDITNTNVNFANQQGVKPLAKARESNQSDIVSLLESLGAKD